MSIIEDIKERLQKHPSVQYHADGDSIEVPASDANGFTVTLHVSGHEYIVAFDGWHEHFEEEAEAANCFIWGLSDECRLKVYSRGKFDYKWVVEYKEGDA